MRKDNYCLAKHRYFRRHFLHKNLLPKMNDSNSLERLFYYCLAQINTLFYVTVKRINFHPEDGPIFAILTIAE